MQRLRGQFVQTQLTGMGRQFVRQATIVDDGIVSEPQHAGATNGPSAMVSVEVDERLQQDRRVANQILISSHGCAHAGMRVQHHDHIGGRGEAQADVIAETDKHDPCLQSAQ